MDQEPDVIRHEIEETRCSITEKLVTLEDQVRGTVQSAKDTVHETIENVRSTVNETVENVKRTFDVSYQTRQHPWGMTGASVAAGFLAGYFLPGLGRRTATMTSRMSEASYSPPLMSNGAAVAPSATPRAATQPSMLSRLTHQFEGEIEKVKALAIGTLAGLARDWVTQAYPAAGAQLAEIMDSATRKLGGQPVDGRVAEAAFDDRSACRH
jgi:ElaB/YqjD/DUF883 family membrane-anchored ribosome-binding protein